MQNNSQEKLTSKIKALEMESHLMRIFSYRQALKLKSPKSVEYEHELIEFITTYIFHNARLKVHFIKRNIPTGGSLQFLDIDSTSKSSISEPVIPLDAENCQKFLDAFNGAGLKLENYPEGLMAYYRAMSSHCQPPFR
jgi:hypothetical protein